MANPLGLNNNSNKKVLLRERKRHTAHHVASTRCAALFGGYLEYSPRPGMGYPPNLGPGTPPDLGLGTPQTWDWVPPYLDLRWGTPLPRPGMGYPPT